MATYGVYATLSDLKTALGIAASDTADDSRLLAILEDASRWIDEHCARWFQPRTETRHYTAEESDRLLLDADLLSVMTLKIDEDNDRDYDYTWAATDYDLMPFNSWPKTSIETTPNGSYTFPTNQKGVQIAGIWGFGYGDDALGYVDSTADTAEELDASETGIDVTSGAAFGVGQCILVESEQMYISAISSNTLTVVRGINGTAAASHATAKDVYTYRYPRNVRRACIRVAARTYRLEAAPFGVTGAADMGTVNVVEAVDRETLHWLAPFRRIPVA